MINLFRSTTIPALQQTLVFTEKRHELLASNVANLDTPDYRARDLSVTKFQSALAEEIDRAAHPSPSYASPGLFSPGDLSPGAISPGAISPGAISPGSVLSGDMTARAIGSAQRSKQDLFGQPITRDDAFDVPREAMEPIVFHDGSDVSLERQVTEIAKNQNMHNVAVATMKNQFAMLRAAISENA